jgi:polar amino acid transport system substrate-binding protein
MSPRAILLLSAFALPVQAAPFACPALTHVGISDLGYLSYQENGANRGAAVDIVAELGKRTGCRFNVEWYPRGRMFVQLSNGQLDLAMSALRSPERDRAGSWVPYSYTQFELLLTSQGGGPFGSLEAFVDRGKGRLNVTRGITYPPAASAQLERLEKQGRLEYVNDYAIVFKKIKAGRADGTLAPPVIYLQHQRRLGIVGLLQAMSISEWPRSLTGVYISHATVSGAVRQGLSSAFYDMVNDGTVQKIYERYLGPEVTREVFAGGIREILDAYPR